MKLKTILESRKRLTEEIVEPSEQIIKGLQKHLKLKTGIIATLGLEKIKPTYAYYTCDLSKEIRTPVLQALFSSMTLDITCSTMPNEIGGYAFSISINYTHPTGGSNGLNIGTIWYTNGTWKSRF